MRGVGVVGGAISLVNAVAAGRGATLGIELGTRAEIEVTEGGGTHVGSDTASSRLARATIERIVPERHIRRYGIRVSVSSEVPAGYGLKSSSAASTAVALACSAVFGPYRDRRVLMAGVRASIDSGVSITGALDDACGCYYGGFNVTDNTANRIARRDRAPRGLSAVIFVPRKRRRGRPKDLRRSPGPFARAWGLARGASYWEAMNINGFAAAPALGSDPLIPARMLGAGALGASVSGNGPAVAAVCRSTDVTRVRRALAGEDGSIIVSRVSNRAARSWTAR
ncbi:MAG: shikimate kinase [Nitrosopumilus sp.]|nr:shikimate kinase [Nitrosopumilus sp.]